MIESTSERPSIITTFGILTFIGAGLSILAGFGGIAGGGEFFAINSILILLSGAKIVGVLKMFKMEKMGFYIYTAAEVAVSIFNVISLQRQTDQMFEELPQLAEVMSEETFIAVNAIAGVIFSLVWIGAYGSQLKNMK